MATGNADDVPYAGFLENADHGIGDPDVMSIGWAVWTLKMASTCRRTLTAHRTAGRESSAAYRDGRHAPGLQRPEFARGIADGMSTNPLR